MEGGLRCTDEQPDRQLDGQWIRHLQFQDVLHKKHVSEIFKVLAKHRCQKGRKCSEITC